jgi:hypothetical protein
MPGFSSVDWQAEVYTDVYDVIFSSSGGTDYEEINDVVFSLQPMSVNGSQLCIPIETLSDGDNTEPAESFFVQATFEDGVDPASATATVDIGGR